VLARSRGAAAAGSGGEGGGAARARCHAPRVLVRVRKGAAAADAALAQMGFLQDCACCGAHALCVFADEESAKRGSCVCPQDQQSHQPRKFGPLWCGALYDATFVAAMADVAKCMASNLDKRMLPLMARIQEEADVPWMYYDVARRCGACGLGLVSVSALVMFLRALGHCASRTHFTDQGIRTDASLQQLHDAIRSLARRSRQ